MKHIIVKEANIETADKYNISNTFIFLLGILKIEVYAEYRGEKADKYKHFVHIVLFGKKILSWFYRDKYIRDFYIK